MKTKYTVEGNVTLTEVIKGEFNSRQEADNFAKEKASEFRKTLFYVTYPDSPSHVHGLDDHHWKYDPYFKQAVCVVHND